MLSKSVITRAKNRLLKTNKQHPIDAIGILKDGGYLYESDLLPKVILPTLRKLSDFDFDDSFFIPLLGENEIDGLFSNDGGIMPACNYIVIGEPGIGKTTMMLWYLASIMKQGKRVLHITGEMSPIDLQIYGKRFPEIKEVDNVFLSEEFAKNDDYDVWTGLEHLFDGGFDLILVDSLAEIVSSIKEQKGWTSVLCEKKFVDLMVKANTKHKTSFIIIQQVTKGGNFVGSNKLKHNTTGMIELRFDKNGDSHFKVSKNRRGFKYDTLYFTLNQTVLFTNKTNSKEIDEQIEKSRKLLDEENEQFVNQLYSEMVEV